MSFNRITISYLHNRGLSQQTVKLDQLVPRSFFLRRFPTRRIRLDDIRFDDFVQFLALEFGRLRHRESQRVWLMVIRSLLRFLAQRGHIPGGWDSAQPGIDNYLHARLPRCLSPEQVRSLFQRASRQTAQSARSSDVAPLSSTLLAARRSCQALDSRY